MSLRKLIFRSMIAMLFFSGFLVVRAMYIPTARDTLEPPLEVVFDNEAPDDLVEIYQEGNLTYYWREELDSMVVYDDRSGYSFYAGTDLEFAKEIDDDCDDALDDHDDQISEVPLETFPWTADVSETDTRIYGYYGELRVRIDDLEATSLETEVSLSQAGFFLQDNQSYILTFDAYADADRDIRVEIFNTVSEVVYLDQLVSLTGDAMTHYYTVDMVDPSADTTIRFSMGTFDSTPVNEDIFFDNISLDETDGFVLVDDSDQLLRGDFELLEEERVVTDADILAACQDKEVRLNTRYTGFANSLISIQYIDDTFNTKTVSSASHRSTTDVESELGIVGGDPSHRLLDIDFEELDIQIKVHIYLSDEGIRYQVLDDDIKGEGQSFLSAIIISPFLGASGGAYETFSLEEMDYLDEEIYKYKIPGYALVPDGSGSLIRFNDNTVDLNEYKSYVYGVDRGRDSYYNTEFTGFVPFKTASMPVFGIAHGNQQAAFVAFATSGDEYLQIVSMPEENFDYYNYTYPRFEYNKAYYQVYNNWGNGYFSLYEERNHFDIDITYKFLAGDGTTGAPADYVGMAQTYREYLVDEGLLSELDPVRYDVPIRLDFFMSDVEKDIIGYKNQITTTVDGVDEILRDVMLNGITNINSGLIGWNDGGVTLGDPRDTDFDRDIGREREFEALIKEFNGMYVDISLVQDYYLINEEIMGLRRNAAQHISSWYARIDTFNYPVGEFYFARPEKSVDWLYNQVAKFADMGAASYTVKGISNYLISDETGTPFSRTQSKNLFIDAFADINEDAMVNGYQPNAYLWPYIDRYLQAPVYGTQFLIETDTVPFLQLVLQNTMEIYGPYSNFSFYTTSDILRMIDYNVFPSFVLTEKPSYLLSDTNSRNFYSTEYTLYEALIKDVYNQVNGALRFTIGHNWVDREVIESGVIVNTYDHGIKIVINYTDDFAVYDGGLIAPLSYKVVGDGNVT